MLGGSLIPDTYTIQTAWPSPVFVAKMVDATAFDKANGAYRLEWQRMMDLTLEAGDRLFVWTEYGEPSWITIGTPQ